MLFSIVKFLSDCNPFLFVNSAHWKVFLQTCNYLLCMCWCVCGGAPGLCLIQAESGAMMEKFYFWICAGISLWESPLKQQSDAFRVRSATCWSRLTKPQLSRQHHGQLWLVSSHRGRKFLKKSLKIVQLNFDALPAYTGLLQEKMCNSEEAKRVMLVWLINEPAEWNVSHSFAHRRDIYFLLMKGWMTRTRWIFMTTLRSLITCWKRRTTRWDVQYQ